MLRKTLCILSVLLVSLGASGAAWAALQPNDLSIEFQKNPVTQYVEWTNVQSSTWSNPIRVSVGEKLGFRWHVSGCPVGLGTGAQPYQSNGWSHGDGNKYDPGFVPGMGPCDYMDAGQVHRTQHTYTYTSPGTYLVTFGYNTCAEWPAGSPICTRFVLSKTCAIVLVGPTAQPPASAPPCVRGNKKRLQILVPSESVNLGTVTGKSGTVDTQYVGVPVTVRIRVADADWALVPGNTDAIALTVDHGTPAMPSPVTLSNSFVSFTVTFNNPGTYVLHGVDSDNDPTDPPNNIADAFSSPIVVKAGGASNGDFNAVDPGNDLDDGVILTKIAGHGFDLDVGSKQGHAFTGTVEVYLVPGKRQADTHCNSGWSGTPAATLTFNNDQTQPANLTYNDALKVAHIGIKTTDNASNVTYSCSTDNFAIRPAYFKVLASHDDKTTAGTTKPLNNASATQASPVHVAGAPFTIRVIAANANGVTTTQYNGQPSFNTLQALGTKRALSAGTWTYSGGIMHTDTATYPDVGAIKARAKDETYAAIDASDPGETYCLKTIGMDWTDVSCTKANPVYANPNGAGVIGRFIPDHFAVTWNAPEFATGCAAGQFTYAGQAFKFATPPVLTLTAKNAKGSTTKNYAGTQLDRLEHGGTITDRNYSDNDAPTDATLDTTGLPQSGDPTLTELGKGQIKLTFSAGAGIIYSHKKPYKPFNAKIDLSIKVTDADGVTATTNPIVFDDIGFDSGAQIRYGRVQLQPAVGTGAVPLAMPMFAQYYQSNTNGFVVNTADTCTSQITQTDFGFSDWAPFAGRSFGNGDTSVKTFYPLDGGSRPATLGNGLFGLTLAAPPAGHRGTVKVTAKVPNWLQFDWDGDGVYDNNPSALATFGTPDNRQHFIFQREVY